MNFALASARDRYARLRYEIGSVEAWMPEADALSTPHDCLIRRVLSRPAAAAVILRRVLPPEVLVHLELDRIEVVPTSFVGPRLRKGTSDLIYSIALRGSPESLFVFAAVEHQSSPLRLLALRMYWYVGWLWERYLASAGSNVRTIPLVFPIVLVQCAAKWNVPNQLSALLDIPPALKGVVRSPIELEFLIDDLAESVLDDPVASPEVLALVELTRALLFAYHHPASIDDARIDQLAPLFDVVLKHSREDAQALWTYVINVFEEDSPLRRMLLDAVSKENQDMGRTYKEAWFAEGMAKGMAKALLELFEHRRWAIPRELEDRVLATQDESTVQRWFRRALAADTLDRVFEPVSESP